jgi:acyl carrier protein
MSSESISAASGSANGISSDLIQRVADVIAKTQHIPVESVTIDKTFQELKIDSLDGMNILFAVESEFDVNIPDDQATQIKSVREMVAGIATLVAQKETAGA